MRHIYCFCIVLLSIFLFACEYSNDGENFKELEKPSPEHVFSVELTPDSKNIVITQSTQIKLNIKTFGLKLDSEKGVKLLLNDKPLNIYRDYSYDEMIYSAHINTYELVDGEYTLSLYLLTQNSGSGSLADKLNLEKCEATMTWPVYIEDLRYNYGNPELMPIKEGQSDEGYLKLFWDKPDIKSELIGYRINYYNSGLYIDSLIADPNTTTFVDKTYTCGDVNYLIYAVVKGFNDNSSYSSENIKYRGQLNMSEPLPEVSILNNYHFRDSLIVNWTKPKYPAQYDICLYSDNKLIVSTSDTATVIEGPRNLGRSITFSLVVKPYSQVVDYYCPKVTFFADKGKYMASNWPRYGYSVIENKVYTNNYDDVLCYDASTLESLRGKWFQGLSYGGYYSCPVNSTQIAALGYDNILILGNSNLQVIKAISKPSWLYNVSHFKMTDNHTLAAVDSWGKTYGLFDTQTGDELFHFSPEAGSQQYIRDREIDTSQDGAYIALANEYGFTLYDIKDKKNAIKIYSDKNSYTGVIFHPFNHSEMYIQTGKKIDIREAPSFNLKRSFDVSDEYWLTNIDPVTGNLLMINNNGSRVVDIKDGKVINQLTYGGNSSDRLYSNVLFANSAYAYDFTKSLGK